MKKLHKLYENLSDIEKKTIINSLYVTEKKSFADIATIYGTYSNRIRRDAKKLQINIRDKSEAQKNALTTGKHSHPTKGKTRSSETKEKIGLSVLQSWENLSDEEIEKENNHQKLIGTIYLWKQKNICKNQQMQLLGYLVRLDLN